MSNVSQWSQTAASNNSASPNGFPEGMAPSGVNDSAREVMAALAKLYACIDGSLTTTGSANAYVLSTGSSHAALADIGLLVFRASFSNTAACTLAVDGLTAKNIYWNGAALISGSIVSGDMVCVVYDPTGDQFEMITNPVDLPSLKSKGLTYPTADGTNGQSIVTNGSGTLSFAAPTAAITRSARTSNTILAAGDLNKIIDVTSGTFSQTITAAATLGSGWFCWYRNFGTGVVTLDPDGSETVNGSTTLALSYGDAVLLQCDGSNFHAVSLRSLGNHEVTVTTGNGHGSTNTKIRRYTTEQVNTGSAITYADSSTDGASFTINQTGLYEIYTSDLFGGNGDAYFGASVNSAQLTTAIESITAADRIVLGYAPVIASNGELGVATRTVRLSSGDVVRPHTDGALTASSALVVFSIRKIQ